MEKYYLFIRLGYSNFFTFFRYKMESVDKLIDIELLHLMLFMYLYLVWIIECLIFYMFIRLFIYLFIHLFFISFFFFLFFLNIHSLFPVVIFSRLPLIML